ncbi:MAG: hypothetical protein ACK5NK_09665 [Niabella sp.]
MKTTILLSILLIAASFMAIGQQKQFDIVSYSLPKGFTEEKNAERVTLTNDGGTNGFCIITVFKSIDASNNSKNNFDASWESLVKNILPVSNPTMQPPVTDDGWETQVGSSPFEKEGIKAAAILLSSTKGNKLVNILVLLSGETYIKEMTSFLESVTMKEVSNNSTQPVTANTGNNNLPNDKKAKELIATGSKADVWVYFRLNYLLNPDFLGNTSEYKFEYFIVYPNGDYYPGFPLDGLHTLDNAKKQNDSWGKFTMNGNKGSFKSKYDVIELEKLSPVLMKRPGYTYQLRKMALVDGLFLEGEWGVYADWEKQPQFSKSGYEGTGVRCVITFKKDGTFIDDGLFVTNLSRPNEAPDRMPGKGTYAIKNFTILLKYDDGRMIYKAFTGAGSIDPAKDDKVFYMNENPYYKKGYNIK